MSVNLIQEESGKVASLSAPIKGGDFSMTLASFLAQMIHVLERSDHKIQGMKELGRTQQARALYMEEGKQLAALDTKQTKIVAEMRSSLAKMKEEVHAMGSTIDKMEGREKEQALLEIRGYAHQLAMLNQNERPTILPIDDVRILPIGGGGVGAQPIGSRPIFSDFFLMRKMMFAKMIEELLAMVDAIVEGGASSTGYPIGMIFVMTSIAAIEYREIQAEALAERQKIINDVTSRFNEVLFLLRQIQSNAGKDNVRDAEQLAADLQKAMTALFGEPLSGEINAPESGWFFDADGNLVPAANSQFAKLIQALGNDFRSNPVYTLINGFARALNSTAPPTNDDTNLPINQRPNISLFLAMASNNGTQMTRWVEVLGRNYYISQNDPSQRPRDYLGPNVQSVTSIQSGCSGFAQQVTMQMQQEMADISTFSDIAKKMIEILDGLIRSVNQNSK